MDLLTLVLLVVVVALLVHLIRDTFVTPSRPFTTASIPESGDPSVKELSLYTLHVPGAKVAHSFSPACTRLDLFLRASGLAYEVKEPDFSAAPLGKTPYMRHGDNLVPDSHYCMQYLANTFAEGKTHLGRVRLQLTPEEKMFTTIINRICDESSYNAIVTFRWINPEIWETTKRLYFGDMPWLLRAILPPMFRKAMYLWTRGQGIARLPEYKIVAQCKEDIDALSSILGSKRYAVSNDDMTPADTSLFGTLDQFLNESEACYGIAEYARGKANLVAYHKRLREEFY